MSPRCAIYSHTHFNKHETTTSKKTLKPHIVVFKELKLSTSHRAQTLKTLIHIYIYYILPRLAAFSQLLLEYRDVGPTNTLVRMVTLVALNKGSSGVRNLISSNKPEGMKD